MALVLAILSACGDDDGHGERLSIPVASETAEAMVPDATQTATPSVVATGVDEMLQAKLGEFVGEDPDVSVVVRPLYEAGGASLNREASFYAASVFKVFVMYEAFRQRHAGELSLDEQLAVTQEIIDASPGYTAFRTPGEQVGVRRALSTMITLSDNVTARLLADRIGWENVQASVDELGLDDTVVSPETMTTTAADYARFLELLQCDGCVDADVAGDSLALLAEQQIRDRIPKYLPSGVLVANKTGSWDDVTHDGGVVYAPAGPYVIVVMIGRGNEHELIAELSRIVYEHLNA
jgi:beta-lactamase class A